MDGSYAEYVYFSASASALQEQSDRRAGAVFSHLARFGAASLFAIHLIHTVGCLTWCAGVLLLWELRTQVGVDEQVAWDMLIATLDRHSGVTPMIDEAVAVGFLIEIGRWAKSELSERWKIRHDHQDTDLIEQTQVKTALSKLRHESVSATSTQDVDRRLALIQRKRDAIYRAQNAKLADRDQLDKQQIPRSAYEARLDEHNATIKELLNEIEGDLESLGFTVERVASR